MQFLYPNVLFFMLIPSFILFFLIITKKDKLLTFFNEDILEKLKVPNSYISNKTRNIFLFIALILMIIALSRPVSNEKEVTLQSKSKPLIVLLDISKSMKANDLYPNRLEFSKKKLFQLMENSEDNSIAVILFAKSSFLLSALTKDFDSLKILINNLQSGTDFDNGTNIFSALELSNRVLNNFTTKNILLLSDGGDNIDFKKEIKFANQNNLKIYIISMATKKGGVVNLENNNYLTNNKGDIVTLKLNENLKTLALNTNGGFINFTINDNDIKEILKDINKDLNEDKNIIKKHKTYVELFYYPLCLAILLIFISFFSLPKIKFLKNIFLLLFVFIFNENLKASIFDFQTIKDAKKAYENKNYNEAINKFENIDSSNERNYNLANSYYKQKNYSKAIELYKQIKSDELNFNFSVLHNLANAYTLNSNYDEAIKSYEKALKLKNDKKTKENLELVKNLKNNDKKENKTNENKRKDSDKQSVKNNSIEKNEANNKNQETLSYEEEKWLKEIENQKAIPLIKSLESSQETKTLNPW